MVSICFLEIRISYRNNFPLLIQINSHFALSIRAISQMICDPSMENKFPLNEHAIFNSIRMGGHFMFMIIVFYCIASARSNQPALKWSQIGVIAVKTIERCLLCKLYSMHWRLHAISPVPSAYVRKFCTWVQIRMRYAHVLSISCINNHFDFPLNFRYAAFYLFVHFEWINSSVETSNRNVYIMPNEAIQLIQLLFLAVI